MRRTLLVLAGLLALARPVAARADGGSHVFTVALKAGGAFHSVFSGLGSTAGGTLEAGAVLLHDHLDLSATLSYDQPSRKLTATDPRLGTSGASFTWTLQQQILVVGLIGRYRFVGSPASWDLYGLVGPRLYMLHTTVDGTSGGQSFGTNEQLDTEVGVVAGLGGEVHLGPGAALLEVDLDAGGLQGLVTGKVAASAVGAVIGYRLMF